MNYFKKYWAKLFFKQWSLGFLKADICEIIRQKQVDLSFEWLKIENRDISWADPFIFRDSDDSFNVFFESFSSDKYDGKISMIKGKTLSEFSTAKPILESDHHLSYPFLISQENKLLVLPENAFGGSVWCYEFDATTNSLINKKEIIGLPLLDSTILKYQDKYWLFGTLLGDHSHSKLYIYYSDNLSGPYTPHQGNPVKNSLNGSRPAGNFIEVDGEIYRPAQNCEYYYGESITINKIKLLNTTEYREEAYMVLKANKKDLFNFGMHTINAAGNMIVVDGQRGYFQPVQQIIRTIRRRFVKSN